VSRNISGGSGKTTKTLIWVTGLLGPDLYHGLFQMCTRFLHVCSALCKCANWLCRTSTSPPYRSRQIICLSHSESVRLPLQLPMRLSPHQLHAGPFHPVHACTAQQHIIIAQCALLVHLWAIRMRCRSAVLFFMTFGRSALQLTDVRMNRYDIQSQ
jgi:hypothetical protein